ncbi:hypothetical protein SAMN05216391_11116 [Lachnospiraceae bacterium KHCPX20]|jgi:hypothetical protein|nr:hypothetical protein SAMN05216391_11116 [Lachnospiraceae bacterium KHCPX20]
MKKREELTKKLLSAYRRYYDITSYDSKEEGDRPKELLARADLNMEEKSYVLLKKNVLWAAESHEYCYILSCPHLTLADYRRFESFVYTDGIKRIHPKKGHKCSVISLIILADSSDPDAIKALRRCHLHKNFKFSLWGWMDFRTVLSITSTKRTYSNLSGHENKKFLNKLYQTGGKRL